MKKKLNSLKYFAPLVQLALCPVTILFLWTVLTGPEVIPEVNDESVREDSMINKVMNNNFSAVKKNIRQKKTLLLLRVHYI